MEATKEQVIRLFLAFIARYVPMEQAQLATLGGRGLEPKIWLELGVPSDHGWLIERSRKRGGTLIINHRYNVHNQLGTFDRILAGHGADRAFVDGFHLDLCGTFSNEAIGNFEPVVPLVLASAGRCLAVTIADQRRNLVLEEWPDFKVRGKRLFGNAAEKIYHGILAQQRQVPVKKDQSFIKPFDAVKATKREFGLLIELTELLRKQKLPWIPVAIERYIYVSHYQARPFRMRSYFFRFGKKPAIGSSNLAFAQAWIESKLFFANGEAFEQVETPLVDITSQPINKGRGERMETISRLALVAAALGGAEEDEYRELLADREHLARILAAFESAKNGKVSEQPIAAASAESPIKRTRKPRMTWEDLTDAERIEWQLKAMELRVQNGGFVNGSWKKLLKESFGYYDENLGRSCRAALARTRGGFRDKYELRIKKVFGENAKTYLDRFAQL